MNRPTNQQSGAPQMDPAVYAELQRLKQRASIGTMAVIAGFASVILFAAVLKNTAAVPAAFFLLVIGALIANKSNKAYSAYYKEHVVRNMTLSGCDFLENVVFEPDGGILRQEVEELQVIHCDRFSSNDLITATYKGVPFRQSDVHMVNISHDKDGHQTETTVFKGRWLIFDFNKDFAWNLQVMSKSFHTANRIGGLFSIGRPRVSKITLENEAFNKQFRVFAEDEHEAFYILTPHMMEALMDLKNGLEAPIMLVFTGGVLHVAVYNSQDAFEGKLFGQLDLEEEKARMEQDLRLITGFVDELALERDIYKNNLE